MITDRQVRLMRQKRMEGKTQETAAAKAGMSVRSARKWQSGPLPSQAKQEHRRRTRPDPFDGVWEDEIEPLLRNDPTGSPSSILGGSAHPSGVRCNDDYKIGGRCTIRSRRCTSPRSIRRVVTPRRDRKRMLTSRQVDQRSSYDYHSKEQLGRLTVRSPNP